MLQPSHPLIRLAQFVIVGILISANLFLLSLLPHTSNTRPASNETATSSEPTFSAGIYDSPNAVTGGLATMANSFERTTATTGAAVSNGVTTAGNAVSGFIHGSVRITVAAVAGTGRFIAHSARLTAYGIHSCVVFAAHTISNTANFMATLTENLFNIVPNAPILGSVVKPAGDSTPPVIEQKPPVKFIASAAMPTMQAASQVVPDLKEASWPILGEVTTLFGVPHWPYQPTHTGLDISSGRTSGVTAIKPFKPGRVVHVARSNWGLGNHVIVDHGAGVTSVYAHLYTLSVQVGQTVDTHTILGYEGSTGASTGTHLHFEIRIDGKPVNPEPYIGTHPQ